MMETIVAEIISIGEVQVVAIIAAVVVAVSAVAEVVETEEVEVAVEGIGKFLYEPLNLFYNFNFSGRGNRREYPSRDLSEIFEPFPSPTNSRISRPYCGSNTDDVALTGWASAIDKRTSFESNEKREG